MNEVLAKLTRQLEDSWNKTDALLVDAYDKYCQEHKGETFNLGWRYKVSAETKFLAGKSRHEQQACQYGRSWYMEENHKMARRFAENLESRLVAVIGQVHSIEKDSTEQSIYSYTAVGANGRAKISQIFAGGYNIVRLHIRNIIRKL